MDVTIEQKPGPEHRTDSGIDIRPVYRAGDLDGWDPQVKLGEPGSFPYTRGFRSSEAYQAWRALLHHFYDPAPVVEHFETVVRA